MKSLIFGLICFLPVLGYSQGKVKTARGENGHLIIGDTGDNGDLVKEAKYVIDAAAGNNPTIVHINYNTKECKYIFWLREKGSKRKFDTLYLDVVNKEEVFDLIYHAYKVFDELKVKRADTQLGTFIKRKFKRDIIVSDI